MEKNKKNILILGGSRGLGLQLAKTLVLEGNSVWAASRSKASDHTFKTSQIDISDSTQLQNLKDDLRAAGFIPDVVVINAAINLDDFSSGIEVKKTQAMMAINFVGALNAIDVLLPIVPKSGQFIAISSASALKGSAFEGIGYPASKAALNIAFESFYQKYCLTGPAFTTISFGPLNPPMRRSQNSSYFVTSLTTAIDVIKKAIAQRKPQYEAPFSLFFLMRLAAIFLPKTFYLTLIGIADSVINKKSRS